VGQGGQVCRHQGGVTRAIPAKYSITFRSANRQALTVREVGLNEYTALAPQDGGHLHVAPITTTSD
jgi:hypothetical protein